MVTFTTGGIKNNNSNNKMMFKWQWVCPMPLCGLQ